MSFQTVVGNCEKCSAAFASDEALRKATKAAPSEVCVNAAVSDRDRTIRDLELELAQTKLALVESECKLQDLTHELSASQLQIEASKSSGWLQKTLSSIREVTSKKDGTSNGGGATSGTGRITKSSSRESNS